MKRQPNRLRLVRAEQRMTQVRLAAKTRIHASRISLIENGYATASEAERQRLARALGVEVTDIFQPAASEALAS